MAEPSEILCEDLDEAIERYKSSGFRLDMIFPADSPREALMSKGSESVSLVADPKSKVQSPRLERRESGHSTLDFGPTSDSEWIIGRAGMEYRDLIPGRLGGKVIASHIRLPFGGEVPDSVHYHKIDFQLIYCVRGRIQVVYEDQGPPFWLETGDCVLQPPEVRHRVLYSEAGAEVIEMTSPAEHETWIDHEMELPNETVDPNREFGSQPFYRFQESCSEPLIGSGYVQCQPEIAEILNQKLSVSNSSFVDRDTNSRERGWFVGANLFELVFVLCGDLVIVDSKGLPNSFEPGDRFRKDDCLILTANSAFMFDRSPDLKLLHIRAALSG